jgi:hypothetical protein
MHNCPFNSILEVARDTACTMNLALLSAFCQRQSTEPVRSHTRPGEGQMLRPAPPVLAGVTTGQNPTQELTRLPPSTPAPHVGWSGRSMRMISIFGASLKRRTEYCGGC